VRFLIAGVGAVGGFAAARLADGGHNVTALARPHGAARLRDDGLRIASQNGVRVLRPSLVTAGKLTPADVVGAMWDKWLYIASIGAVTSLMRASVGEIVAVPGGERFARSVLAEAAAAAAACGHPVPVGQLRVTEHALTAPGSSTTSSLYWLTW
jgi:ketopantoate reductase